MVLRGGPFCQYTRAGGLFRQKFHMLMPPEKHFKMLKNSEQKFGAYISRFYGCTPSIMGTNIFYVLCKKDKEISCKKFFSTKICLFYT
jgi:hypothetical protein